LSKIYSALAYYWDNKEEIDADIERREQYAEQLEQEAVNLLSLRSYVLKDCLQ
jgi:hypothetical protein